MKGLDLYLQWAESILTIKLLLLPYYFALGLVFALFFFAKGKKQLDAAVTGSSWGFYLLIMPSILVLWPVLLAQGLFQKIFK